MENSIGTVVNELKGVPMVYDNVDIHTVFIKIGKEQNTIFNPDLNSVDFSNMINGIKKSHAIVGGTEGVGGIGNSITETVCVCIETDSFKATVMGMNNVRKVCYNEKDLLMRATAETTTSAEEGKSNLVIILSEDVRNLTNLFDYDLQFSIMNIKILENRLIDDIFDKSRVKTYTYKKTYTIKDVVNNDIQYVFEIIKVGSGNSFTESKVLEMNEKYNVKIQIAKSALSGIQNEVLIEKIKQILKFKENSFYVISNERKERALQNYKSIAKANNFIGISVLPLKMEHVVMDITGHSYLNNGTFSVTEKADGDRYLMIVSSDGLMYLMNKELQIKYSGLECNRPEFYNSIFDGELVASKINNTKLYYLIFDCLFLNNRDVRANDLIYGPAETGPAETGQEESKTTGPVMSEMIGRYDYVIRFVKAMSEQTATATATATANRIRIIIDKKTYLYETGQSVSIYDLCKSIYDPDIYDYNLDGLIFTPINKPYPVRVRDTIIMKDLLKWKPIEQLSIDFYVEFKKNNVKLDIDTNVSSNVRIDGTNDRNVVMKYVVATLKTKSRGELVLFKPSKFLDRNSTPYLTKLYLDKNLSIMTRHNEVILTDSVVEFVYETEKNNWIPLRIRKDKTLEKNPNSLLTAIEIWETIMKPVSRAVITGQDRITISGTDSYYSDLTGVLKMTTKSLRNYNNRLKEYLIKYAIDKIKQTQKQTQTQRHRQRKRETDTNTIRVLDLGIGKGNDLYKYTLNNVDYVLGIDISNNNLLNETDGAIVRYEKLQLQNNEESSRNMPLHKVPSVDFVWGDVSKNINNGDAGMDTDNTLLLRNIFNGNGSGDRRTVGPVGPVGPVGLNGFNLVNCQFVIHYLFKDITTFNGFIGNVQRNISRNGLFIYSTLNGRAIYDKFLEMGPEQTEITGYKQIDGKSVLIWKITRKFDLDISRIDMIPFGKTISVYNISIGTEFDEYLVDPKQLDTQMLNASFRKDEFNIQLFNNNRQNMNILMNMSEAEKQYEALHMFGIYMK